MVIQSGNSYFNCISNVLYYTKYYKCVIILRRILRIIISYVTPLRYILCCPFQRSWLRKLNILHVTDRDVPRGTSCCDRLGGLRP